jgi:hypothetical protein
MARHTGVAAALAAAVALALVASAAAAYPTLIPARDRDPANPQTKMCVCVDEGINTDACIGAVKNYCLSDDSPDGKICTFFRGLINSASKEGGQLAGGFLAKTCGVLVPLSSNACACLEVRGRCGVGRVPWGPRGGGAGPPNASGHAARCSWACRQAGPPAAAGGLCMDPRRTLGPCVTASPAPSPTP